MKLKISIINIFLIITLVIIIVPVNADIAILKHDYIINYYKDNISDGNLIETIRGADIYGKEIKVDTTYKVPDGYSYNGEELLFNIKEYNNEINVIYSKKNNLTYCINYFYDGIVAINNTDCFYNQTYGKEITSFIDKPKEGYVFDSFEPITVLDIEENIMNVYYKKVVNEEIIIPKPSVTYTNNIVNNLIKLLKKIIRTIY